jgi:hypothetical protein
MATKAKKVPAKKVVARKVAVKKTAAKRVSAKKAPAKKLAAKKKVVAKKAVAKKVPAKKAAAKKVAGKKAVAKKSVAKKVAPKKVVARKPAAKKAAPKKVATQKAVAKKVAVKAVPAKKVPAKATPKKAAPRKVASRSVLDYDPRAQLDKLSADEEVPVGRGLDAAPEVDVDAVLGEFFALRRDEPLTPEVAAAGAAELGVEVAALRALAQVESGGAGFDKQGRPVILYERQVFSRNTAPKGRFDAQSPDISAPKGYGPGGYGTSAAQWPKLARAYQLDGDAALKACSWGTFQILGENHKASGFPDVRSFVAEMFASPAGHLRALVRFIKANPAIHQGLKNHDWAAVAQGYNGKAYKNFSYDTKLAAAYEKLK